MTVAISSKTSSIQSPQPWVEKYRPKSLGEVAAQDRVICVLKKAVADSNLPHLLFYGPPGTGKTSTVLALARDIFGESFKERVLELNASDERGIAVVRTKIKDFAKTVVSSNSTLPPYKLIILDEADSMTSDAQAALRRTMETYSVNTRFCIICNYVNKIMDPLSSRCAKFRFQRVEKVDAVSRLTQIADAEAMKAEKDALEFLVRFCDGDLRKAINFMQSAHRFLSQQPDKPSLTVDFLHDLTGYIPDSFIANFIDGSSKTPDNGVAQAAVIIRAGFSVLQFISQIYAYILESANFKSIQKSLIAAKLSTYQKRLADGSDAELLLLSLSADIYEYLSPTCKNISV